MFHEELRVTITLFIVTFTFLIVAITFLIVAITYLIFTITFYCWLVCCCFGAPQVVVLEEIDADWLRGDLNGLVGIFPRGFVELLEAPKSTKPEEVAEEVPGTDAKETATPAIEVAAAAATTVTDASSASPVDPQPGAVAIGIVDFDVVEDTDLGFKQGQKVSDRNGVGKSSGVAGCLKLSHFGSDHYS